VQHGFVARRIDFIYDSEVAYAINAAKQTAIRVVL